MSARTNGKVFVDVGMSLDGLIAGTRIHEWLFGLASFREHLQMAGGETDPDDDTPVFALTHKPRDPWVRPGGTTFHFVTDGFDSALEQARAAAGVTYLSCRMVR